MKDQKILSLRTHKTFLRKMIRDERLQPRLKLCAELFLAYLEEIYPRELIESVLRQEFGISEKLLKEKVKTIEEGVDEVESSSLRDELKELMEDRDGRDQSSNSTN